MLNTLNLYYQLEAIYNGSSTRFKIELYRNDKGYKLSIMFSDGGNKTLRSEIEKRVNEIAGKYSEILEEVKNNSNTLSKRHSPLNGFKKTYLIKSELRKALPKIKNLIADFLNAYTGLFQIINNKS